MYPAKASKLNNTERDVAASRPARIRHWLPPPGAV